MVSVDDAGTNKKFAEENHADYPILSDPDKKTAFSYGVIPPDRPPDRQFASRWTFYIGPDGKILDIDKKVSVRTAGADVIAKLEALAVKKIKK
jgi:peroxiredoxin Q/BCP